LSAAAAGSWLLVLQLCLCSLSQRSSSSSSSSRGSLSAALPALLADFLALPCVRGSPAVRLPVTNLFFNLCSIFEEEGQQGLCAVSAQLAQLCAPLVLPQLADGGWQALPLAWSCSYWQAVLALARSEGGLHPRLLSSVSEGASTQGGATGSPLICKLLLGRASGQPMHPDQAAAAELLLAAAGAAGVDSAARSLSSAQGSSSSCGSAAASSSAGQSQEGSVVANFFGWVEE
jgi:hypothetical protein